MKRILTAAVLIPLAIVLVFWAPFWLFTVACAVVAELALWEYLSLADAMGAKTQRVATCACVGALFFCAFRFPDLLTPVLGCIALILLVLCTFRSPLHEALPGAASSYFGILYIGLSLVTLPLLSAQENGPALLLFLFFAVWSGDIAALYVGKLFGRHKMAPRLSPGKTWEGAAASLAASALSAWFLIWLAGFLTSHYVNALAYPKTRACP